MDINQIIEKLKEKTFKAERIPYPKDEKAFTVPSQLVIEIGCGVGMHPLKYAITNLDKTFVALEHTSTRFKKFENRYVNHNSPKNLILKHENAISWITHKLPDCSVDNIFLLYPNPFPKPNDWNKRWFCMPFFSKLIAVLKKGGTLTLATNEKFYFEEAIKVNEGVWNLQVIEQEAFKSIESPRTHFEKKYLERNQTCYNFIIKK